MLDQFEKRNILSLTRTEERPASLLYQFLFTKIIIFQIQCSFLFPQKLTLAFGEIQKCWSALVRKKYVGRWQM